MATGMDDRELIQRYAQAQDHEAFAQLVRRHGDWVYSSARRQVGDSHLAEDITQAVFLLLSRRARTLGSYAYLSGWLFKTLRYCARAAIRQRSRRQHHERQAIAMTSTQPPAQPDWSEISPILDEALARLRTSDREAVLLRFYEQKPLAEVGRLLGITEEAARKRVDRAVDKLRQTLAARGVEAQTLHLSAVILARALEPSPAGLLQQITASIAQGITSGPTGAIANGATKALASAKLKVMAAMLAMPLIGGIWLAAAFTGSPSPGPATQARVPATMPATSPAAAPTELPGGTFTLRGIVLDPAGKPIEGARVWLPPTPGERGMEEPRETRTDAQGHYELGGIPMPPTGTVTGSAIIDKQGFALAWAEVQRGNMFTDDLPRTYRLGTPLTIEGEVVDEMGKPIADAIVMPYLQQLVPPYYGYVAISEAGPYVARTDAAGRFSVGRLPDNCRAHLTVIANGFAAYRSDASYRSDEFPYVAGAKGVRITLHPGGQCTVQLKGGADQPSGRVVLTASKDSGRPERAVTNDKGEAVFPGLLPGTYTISAQGGRWVPAQNVQIEPGSRAIVTLLPVESAAGQVRHVRGRLLDEGSGQPLKQGIYVTRPGARAWGEQECETKENGEFSLDLPPGEHELVTLAWVEGRPAEARMEINVPADADLASLVWKVHSRKMLRGILVDEQGKPLAGTVNPCWPEYVGPDGRFEVDEPNTSDGPQRCFAVDAGKRLGVTFRYDREHRLDEYRLVLRPLVTVKGNVVDGEGRPVPLEERDLMITIDGVGRYASFYRLESSEDAFAISRLPLGLPMRLQVSHAGVSREFSLGDMKPGEVRDLGQIVLSPAVTKGTPSSPRDGKLSGRLVGPDGKGLAGLRVYVSGLGALDSAHESITDQDGGFTLSRLPADTDLSLFCSGEVFGRARLHRIRAGKTDIVWQLKPIAADLVGKPAPPLQVSQWIKGELPDLQTLRGQVVLLNVGNQFRRRGLQDAMSEFDQVARTYASKGVVAAMIVHPLPRQSSDWELDLVDAAAYVEDAKWSFAVGEDRTLDRQTPEANAYSFTGKTEAAYDCRRPNVTYVIDKHGILRGVALVNELDAWVRKLMAEP